MRTKTHVTILTDMGPNPWARNPEPTRYRVVVTRMDCDDKGRWTEAELYSGDWTTDYDSARAEAAEVAR